MNIRVGHGYDVHQLVPERNLILGGISVPHMFGLLGHSDADVLVHAIMDALLGAIGMGDIGKLFPDSSTEFAGISSLILLDRVMNSLQSNGWQVGNIDATIIAQQPKLATFIPEMRKCIATHLHISEEQVNVKATTEEGLGFTGSKQGIAAHCVALVHK